MRAAPVSLRLSPAPGSFAGPDREWLWVRAHTAGAELEERGAINVRCLDGVDIPSLSVDHFDGKSM